MIKVSGCRHLIGEKLWVTNIGKNPYNISVKKVCANLSPRIQVHHLRRRQTGDHTRRRESRI